MGKPDDVILERFLVKASVLDLHKYDKFQLSCTFRPNEFHIFFSLMSSSSSDYVKQCVHLSDCVFVKVEDFEMKK